MAGGGGEAIVSAGEVARIMLGVSRAANLEVQTRYVLPNTVQVRRRRSRQAPPRWAPAAAVTGLARARNTPRPSWKLRVKWADRQTESLVSIADIEREQDGALPRLIVAWVDAAVSSEGPEVRAWWVGEH